MLRLAWLTDLHFNFLRAQQIDAFLRAAGAHPADAYLISGDIGEAHSLIPFLERIDAALQRPVYFVLGNHDFYFSSIKRVRRAVEKLCRELPRLSWLPQAGLVELTPDAALIGHDGWADGRCGDYQHSDVLLNDYFLIGEFLGLEKAARLEQMMALGDEAADYFRQALPAALERYRQVIVATHVPPFKESCWHEGGISDDNFLPHFTCQAVGDVLGDAMRQHPDRQMTVLCGHTHGAGRAQILPNLLVLTGGAEYGAPTVQRVFEID